MAAPAKGRNGGDGRSELEDSSGRPLAGIRSRHHRPKAGGRGTKADRGGATVSRGGGRGPGDVARLRADADDAGTADGPRSCGLVRRGHLREREPGQPDEGGERAARPGPGGRGAGGIADRSSLAAPGPPGPGDPPAVSDGTGDARDARVTYAERRAPPPASRPRPAIDHGVAA